MKKLRSALMLLLTVASALGCLLSCMHTATLTARLEQVERSSRADMNYLRGYIRRLEGELTQSVIDRLEAIARPQDTPVGGGACEDSKGESTQESVTETETPLPESETLPVALPLPETYPEQERETAGGSNTEGEVSTGTHPESEAVTLPAILPETLPVWESESSADGTASETTGERPVETTAEADRSDTEGEMDTECETETLELPTHDQTETQPAEPAPVLYTVAAHNGRIGVFDATGRLIREVNVFLFALPTPDREALTVGIPAYSREEMLDIVKRYE